MYSKEALEQWESIQCKGSYRGDGDQIFPRVLTPTMKELQLSKGAIWKNTLNEKGKVVSNMGDRMALKTGIRPKGTHFKMDLGQKKVALSELLVIQAKDDNSLNDFTRKVELLAIPVKNARKRK